MKKSISIKPKIVFHCQYVYGIGHFVRTVELARGLSKYFSVYILNGGERVPNFDISSEINIIQLPAIYKDENANFLSPIDSNYSIDECFLIRQNIIYEAINNLKPEILITEHFPFGLLFKNEVLDLITRVKLLTPNAKIVCSVRDIIESARGSKYDKITLELLNKWYDMVLIHSDENYYHLKNSFSKFNEILVKHFHTGYIVNVNNSNVKTDNVKPIILASIAGGRLGKELLSLLISSHVLLNQTIKHKLVLFTGAFESNIEKLKDEIRELNSNDIELYSFDRKSYLNYFSKADLVISLGGYNSIIESISNHKKLLVYKREFTQGNEEQDLRIKLFNELGLLDVIYKEDLDNVNIVDLIIKSLNSEVVKNVNINVKGVEFSTDLILKMYNIKLNLCQK